MPSLVQNRRSRRVAAILTDTPAASLTAIRDLAKINVERTGEVFRLVAVGYISLPVALAALLSDAAPEFMRSAIASNVGNILFWIFVLAATPIVYFCGMWRARQLLWAIEAYQAGAIEPFAEGL